MALQFYVLYFRRIEALSKKRIENHDSSNLCLFQTMPYQNKYCNITLMFKIESFDKASTIQGFIYGL